MDVVFEGIELRLLAGGGVYWPARNELLVADLHLGKASTFRSAGLPVPTGSSASTLAKISRMLEKTSASKLTVLGDMFHAPASYTDAMREQLSEFFQRHGAVRTTLIRGNHDSKLPRFDGLPMEIVADMQIVERVALTHFPQPPPEGSDLLLCGHIHPAVRFGGERDRLGKLPCFHFTERQLILPAAGEFTGTQLIKRTPGDRVWLIAEEHVISV